MLAPYNPFAVRDPDYAPTSRSWSRVCAERGVAVQTIKAITRGPWARGERTSRVWYEPLREQADIDLAVAYVLGRPGLFLNTVGDPNYLPAVIDAAERFVEAPEPEAIDALLERATMSPLFVS